MGSKEVAMEILPFIRVYKDGSVDRLADSPRVPPSPEDPATGVSSKDIVISQNPRIPARLFLPKLRNPTEKIPILIYCHGGGFSFESAFSSDHFRYLNALVSAARVVAVCAEFRLAPEHPLPVAYEDSWSALKWVASQSSSEGPDKEPWLTNHGNFERLFVGGDSSGGNIAHNLVMRAGSESLPEGVKIEGAFLTHPFFWGSEAIGSEKAEGRETTMASRLWQLVYPEAAGGVDNPMVNPLSPEAPSLAGLGCSRLLVSVSGKDGVRDRGVWYYDAVRKSGWGGEAELVEVDGESHAFQFTKFGSASANFLILRLASFLQN